MPAAVGGGCGPRGAQRRRPARREASPATAPEGVGDGRGGFGSLEGEKEVRAALEVAKSPHLEVFRNRGNVAPRDADSGRGGDGLVDGLDGS